MFGSMGNILRTYAIILRDRFQIVLLNWQSPNWCHIKAGIPQGSILGPIFEGLSSVAKLFADDTSFSSVVHDPITTSLSLNEDFLKTNQWAYHWKMFLNPDTSKQAQEMAFSRKEI